MPVTASRLLCPRCWCHDPHAFPRAEAANPVDLRMRLG